MAGEISKFIVAVITTSFLSACTKEPPKCSDDETFSLVRKIILDQIGGGEGLSEKEIKDNMKIDFPRASAFDEKIKKFSCEAKLTVGGIYELPVTYESQLDDKNQHIVSVGGIGRRDLLALKDGMIEGIRKTRSEKIAPTPQVEAQPTPSQNTTQSPKAASSDGVSIEIDIKNEIDLKDGTYLAKEYSGQGRYAFITHSHGRFEGGDVSEAVCTDGFSVKDLPEKFKNIKTVLNSTDFVLTKCDQAK